MHEYSLCRNILEIVQRSFAEQSFKCIKTIYLELGDKAAVDKAALLFAFEILSKKTLAEDANLFITDAPGYELRVKSMEVQ